MPRAQTSHAINSLFGSEPSRIMQEILEVLRRLALSDMVVLFVGEAGTERERLAERVHELSGRATKSFIHVDCSSLSRESIAGIILGYEDLTLEGTEIQHGMLEKASGGTLFLDNIDTLPPDILRKLEAIISYQQFRRVGGSEEVVTHVRFILGQSKMLGSTFNHPENDISHRLCPVIVNLPPLRDRRDDIVYLLKEFMLGSQAGAVRRPLRITGEALSSCYMYDWPGNAQELKMVVEHSLKLCTGNVIQLRHLPEYLRDAATQHVDMREEMPHDEKVRIETATAVPVTKNNRA